MVGTYHTAGIYGLNVPKRNSANLSPLIITDEVADRWNAKHSDRKLSKVPKNAEPYYNALGYRHFVSPESQARLA